MEEFTTIRRIRYAALTKSRLLLEEDESADTDVPAEQAPAGFVHPCMTICKTGVIIFDSSSTIRVSLPAIVCV